MCPKWGSKKFGNPTNSLIIYLIKSLLIVIIFNITKPMIAMTYFKIFFQKVSCHCELFLKNFGFNNTQKKIVFNSAQRFSLKFRIFLKYPYTQHFIAPCISLAAIMASRCLATEIWAAIMTSRH